MILTEEAIGINLPLCEGNGHPIDAVLFHFASDNRKGIAKFIIIRLEIVFHFKPSKASAIFSSVSVDTFSGRLMAFQTCAPDKSSMSPTCPHVIFELLYTTNIRLCRCSLSRCVSVIFIYYKLRSRSRTFQTPAFIRSQSNIKNSLTFLKFNLTFLKFNFNIAFSSATLTKQ
jgi:hypothetical protein